MRIFLHSIEVMNSIHQLDYLFLLFLLFSSFNNLEHKLINLSFSKSSKSILLLTYSIIQLAKGQYRWVFSPTNLTFNLQSPTTTLLSPATTILNTSYSQIITEHREKGMTVNNIAEWLNKEGYLTVRGKKFRDAYAHSILKKNLAKEELMKRDYSTFWSDFCTEVVDKTILKRDFGFKK